ncbi:MAG: hypothetical protein V7676_05505 [Parasphingorhabdus sp.]|uniref:hypothetical protein n=1 Tax=Parasphingorhabdus sp. TaxID=2709688 RepID=UPI0030035D3C
MIKLWVSHPLADLLDRVGLLPDYVDAQLEERIEKRAAAILGYGDEVPKKIRTETGFEVVAISRAHGRLLVHIEQRKSEVLRWTYREHSRNHCIFECPGIMPNTYQASLLGKPLAELAKPGFAASEAIIESIVPFADGWIKAHVAPIWRQFERNRRS